MPPTGVSFDALYSAHSAQVFIWAMRYARGQRGWAEDVTHEVFLKAWQHRAWLREEDVRGWLFRVTQNCALSALRRESTVVGQVRRVVESLFGEAPVTPEEQLQRQQLLGTATEMLNRLPAQERVVMAMKTLDGLSQREIAKVLSLSESYVSKLLGRAEKKLAEFGWEVRDDAP